MLYFHVKIKYQFPKNIYVTRQSFNYTSLIEAHSIGNLNFVLRNKLDQTIICFKTYINIFLLCFLRRKKNQYLGDCLVESSLN